MNPIVKHTLAERKWSTVWWCVGLGAWVAINLLVYGTVRDQSASLNQFINGLPHGAKTLLAADGNVTTPLGYLSAKLYSLFLPLLFSGLMISLGRSLIGHEEQNKTLELVLSRPVSRGRFLRDRLTAALCIGVAVAAFTWLVTVACAAAENMQVSSGRLALATLVALVFALLLGSTALLFTALGRRSKRLSIGLAVIIGLGGYLASSLSSYGAWLGDLAKCLPYHYYDAVGVLRQTNVWWHTPLLLAVTVLLLTASCAAFNRRDIA